jgi:hypothetical protein
MPDRPAPGRGATTHRGRALLVLATLVALLAALTVAVPVATAATTTAMVPACDRINVRTGSSTGSSIKATLAASSRLTVSGSVSGGAWRALCPTAKSGSTWYRVTAINGTSVASRYGVPSLYAATGVLTAPPAATSASSAADPFAAELMRLINLDRKALGKIPYLIDGRLADIARDARFTCPTNPAKSFRGRARDMADRGYFSHTVPGCYSSGTTPFRSIDIVKRVFGYAGARSEILHWNSYGTAKTTYRVGCDINGRNCAGGSTTAPYTVTLAQRNFMSSAPHRAAELNSYQRFGCGTAKAPGSSKTYFACLFADGGSSIAPAPATTTMAPACNGVNLRTGPSTSRAIKARLRTSARLTVVARVAGAHWSTTCPTRTSGSGWYKVSAIDGRSVKSLYGVTWLYAATGVLKKSS